MIGISQTALRFSHTCHVLRGLRRLVLFAIAVAGPCVPATAETLRDKTVRIAVFPDYPPFNTDTLPRGGFATALVEDAFRRAGLEAESIDMPWRRGVREVELGRLDATHPWFYREDRGTVMLFTDPFILPKETIFTRADSEGKSPIRSEADLSGRTVCSPVDYALPEPVQSLAEAGQVLRDSPKNVSDCVRMLVAGRVDFVVLSPVIYRSEPIQQIVAGQHIVEAPIEIAVEPYYVMIGRKNQRAVELVEAFNEGVKEMAADGSLAALADAYGIPHAMLPHLAGQ
ncbi:hypothetical protein GCM10011316_27590 [Roseibium aquae]|uniref:Solute-binding protein family 3/N-terminal domain-containing protein n=1 Tax=Roseibium aquae TaxID=1323746 RepID=A0A916X2E5_9HYPH|nr:transporter substrate-binding domain-containing protein [Roseibium aquae]GGB54019.1 hypothetical protein GCM10011316_27590 [Roseibium aquae]